MLHALLLASLLGQVLYEWVDAQGESHFTDDRSTIPRGVKVRTTEGEAVSEVSAAPPRRSPSAAAPAVGKSRAPGPDRVPRCADAVQRVTEAEAALERAREDFSAQQQAHGEHCQALLRTHGQVAFADCMNSVAAPGSLVLRTGEARRQEALTGEPRAVVVRPFDPAPYERRIEEAREALRRTQVDGCR